MKYFILIVIYIKMCGILITTSAHDYTIECMLFDGYYYRLHADQKNSIPNTQLVLIRLIIKNIFYLAKKLCRQNSNRSADG